MPETLRVLMVGGTGYIGQRLGQKLTEAGHQVAITTRHPDQWVQKTSFPCQVIPWNPAQEDFPLEQKAMERPDVVINLAGAGIGDQRWTLRYKQTLRDSRLVTTQKIAQSITHSAKTQPKGAKPIHLVQASAIGFYGSQGDTPLAESSPQGKGFLADLCGDWEREALKAQTQHNRVAIVRIGVVLGHGSGFLNTLAPLYLRGAGALIGGGTPWFPWVHAQDLVSILFEATTNPTWNGIFNGTAPQPTQMRDLHRLMVGTFGRQFAPPVPAWVVKTLLGQQSEMVLGSHKVLSGSLAEKNFKFKFETIGQAFEDLYATAIDRKSYHVVSQQWFPHHKRELWNFFSTESNLEIMTPPWLSFKVLSKSTPEIQSGTTLNYQLKLHGIPLKWETKIDQWQPAQQFVDTQTKGPYALWHHTHSFEDHAGGTLMTDHVRLRLPLGKLGFLVASPMVLRDVARIFNYRKHKIAEIFGKTPHAKLVNVNSKRN